MDYLMSFITAIGGIIIGATLQYRYMRNHENIKFIINKKEESFEMFLQAVSGVAIAQKNSNDAQEKLFITNYLIAKTNILLYGSADLIDKLAIFERSGSMLKTPEQQSNFHDLVSIMRRDTGLFKDEIKKDDLLSILF